MRIPLLTRGRLIGASSADPSTQKTSNFYLPLFPKFRNPLPHPSRVAVLQLRFGGNNVRVFTKASAPALQTFRPAVLAGSLLALRELSYSVFSLKAVVVFTDSCSSPLSESAREWLWRRFAVPCFEQLLTARGEVIAEECHVHAGLHVLRPGAISGLLTSVECDCGRTEPRLVAEPVL